MATRATWRPQQADYQRIFDEQNPWHRPPHEVPPKLSYDIERPIVGPLAERLLANPARRDRLVMILGPRRVGKTVSMYQVVRRLLKRGVAPRRLWWLHMAHPLLTRVDLGDLIKVIIDSAGASDAKPACVFVDEVTYARDWALWLKTIYDEAWPVRLVATSSAAAALRRQRHESGIGRWDEHYLPPYSFAEYLALVHRDADLPEAPTLAETLRACIDEPPQLPPLGAERRRFMLSGGFPELLLWERTAEDIDEGSVLLQSQKTLGADAVKRAIYQDIPQVFGIDNPLVLERLLYVLGGQVTGILSPKSICQELDGLSQPTFDKYLSYLEQSFLVFTLQNYAATEAGKQKRGRKLYFVDAAVRNAALQRGLAPLNDSAETGLLLENLAASHLHALGQQAGVRVHYWRDGRLELDLIYDHPTDPIAFEIGSSQHHPRHAAAAFAGKFARRFAGRVFIAAPDAPARAGRFNGDGVGSLPLDVLLLAAGRAATADLTRSIRPPQAASLFDPDPT